VASLKYERVHDVVRYWDLAATEKTGSNDSDWTVGIKLGRDKNGGYRGSSIWCG
jgi:phage terminase large subunit-like protein